jgi:hypothetical protein
MYSQRLPDGAVTLHDVNPWALHTFQSIAQLGDPTGHAGAEARIFQRPVVAEDATPEMLDEWREYVVPELQSLFQNAVDTVIADVAAAKVDETPAVADEDDDDLEADPDEPRFIIHIPADHVEDWYRALNQARLCMSERHGIDSDRQSLLLELIASGQVDVLFQYELFTGFQDWLIRAVMWRETAEESDLDPEQLELDLDDDDDPDEGDESPSRRG